jgi:8-oxo-dGTP diphosphatase
MNDIPRIGVGVIVQRDGRVLVGLRRGAHGAGSWALPGGLLEFGETVFACAHREVREETGLAIRDLSAGPWVSTVFADDGLHHVTLFVVARAEEGDAERREPHKCDEWRWCAWDALPRPLFAPLDALRSLGFEPR